jgi:hypothetical protein
MTMRERQSWRAFTLSFGFLVAMLAAVLAHGPVCRAAFGECHDRGDGLCAGPLGASIPIG